MYLTPATYLWYHIPMDNTIKKQKLTYLGAAAAGLTSGKLICATESVYRGRTARVWPVTEAKTGKEVSVQATIRVDGPTIKAVAFLETLNLPGYSVSAACRYGLLRLAEARGCRDETVAEALKELEELLFQVQG